MTLRDAKRVLESHVEARRLTVMLLNLANVFGADLLTRDDAVHRLTRLVVAGEEEEENQGVVADEDESCSTRLLYSPLLCRTKYSSTRSTERRVRLDVYSDSAAYIEKFAVKRRSVVIRSDRSATNRDASDRFGHDDDSSFRFAAAETDDNGGGNAISGREEYRGSEYAHMLADLRKCQRTLTIGYRRKLNAERTVVVAGGDDERRVLSKDIATPRSANDSSRRAPSFISSAKRLGRATATFSTDGGGQRLASTDAMREFLSSWQLDEYARNNADRACLLNDLTPKQAVCAATFYLLLLARERIRHSRFAPGCSALRGESTVHDAKCPLIAANANDTDADNLFGRLTRDPTDCLVAVRRLYPEMYIQSYDTNSLANGLALYVSDELAELDRPRHSIAYAISLAVMSLYIYSRGDLDILMFFIRYITAIRYPGQFLKSVLLLQGTSDSGKSEFVSEVLRQIFSSALTGTISNATLRQGVRDEVNTDLMSMMNSHVCQCDEPERLNSELFKLLVSRTQLKGRMFHEQQPQYITNLAKIIFTANDHISMRSDAGVITRLKFCVRMLHRFKILHAPDFDTGIDFGDTHATASVSHQFATRCFPQGVSFPNFRLGVFLTMEHYGINMCEYNEAFFTLSDTIARRLERSSSKKNLPRRDLLQHCRLALLCGALTNSGRRRRRSGDGFRRSSACEEDGGYRGALIDDNRRSRDVTTAVGSFSDREEDGDDLDIANDDDRDDDDDTSGDDDRRLKDAVVGGDNDDEKSEEDAIVGQQCLFSTYATTQLLAPIQIAKIPDAMIRDAHNLHTLIDPYQLLLCTYEIRRDVTVNMSETALVNFLRTFLEESCCVVSQSNVRDTVNKMKERLKMDYPVAFRVSDNVFNLIFREHKQQRR